MARPCLRAQVTFSSEQVKLNTTTDDINQGNWPGEFSSARLIPEGCAGVGQARILYIVNVFERDAWIVL